VYNTCCTFTSVPNLYVGKCKLGLGTVIRTPFASNKGYKATKRSDKHKGKEGDKSNKVKSGRKESGQVLRQRKGTWYVHLQEWFIQVICWLRMQSFAKELLSYTLEEILVVSTHRTKRSQN